MWLRRRETSLWFSAIDTHPFEGMLFIISAYAPCIHLHRSFVPRRGRSEMLLDGGEKRLGAERFGEIVLCPRQATFQAIKHAMPPGKHDNGNVAILGPG